MVFPNVLERQVHYVKPALSNSYICRKNIGLLYPMARFILNDPE